MTNARSLTSSARLAAALLLFVAAACSAAPTEREDARPVPLPPVVPQAPSVPGTPSNPGANPTWDLAARGVPPLVEASYIDLSRIEKVSRFRSGAGHDYSDDYEKCRSMKHYFQPQGPGSTWGDVAIFAPVSGRVTRVFAEWAGSQVQVRSSAYPAFTVILFHVSLARPYAEGDSVTAGAQIGLHVGGVTSSDIAIVATTPGGRAFVSYFDAMPAALFAPYVARGVPDRAALVTTRAERDASPLACNGEAFVGTDPIPLWVPLR